MKWYTASLIIYFKFKNENQDYYPVWENIVLINALNEEEAFEKAIKIGKESEGDTEGSLTWDNKPATVVFAGVRKLITCENEEYHPQNGTEVSYSQFIVRNYDSLIKLVEGDSVEVLYEV